MKLVRFYNGATGLKTGTTDGAGSCLSASATRDGLSIIAVVMGCPTSNDRFASARGLLDFGFANFESVAPPSIDAELRPVPVLRGVEESVMPVYDAPGKILCEKGKNDKFAQEITLVESLEAPIEAGQVVGKVEVMIDGEIVMQYDLKAGSDVERMTFIKAFSKLGKTMFQMGKSNEKTEPETHEPATIIATAADTATAATTAETQLVKFRDRVLLEDEVEDGACVCGMDKCFCKEIGDICGCTRGDGKDKSTHGA